MKIAIQVFLLKLFFWCKGENIYINLQNIQYKNRTLDLTSPNLNKTETFTTLIHTNIQTKSDTLHTISDDTRNSGIFLVNILPTLHFHQ